MKTMRAIVSIAFALVLAGCASGESSNCSARRVGKSCGDAPPSDPDAVAANSRYVAKDDLPDVPDDLPPPTEHTPEKLLGQLALGEVGQDREHLERDGHGVGLPDSWDRAAVGSG